MKTGLIVALLFFSFTALAAEKGTLIDQAKRAAERSQLTSIGARPFHLKASVFEATNRDNDSYRAEIEETWVSPTKWRRTIKSNSFSAIWVQNGDKTSEQTTGDYYPNWLRNIVSAILDPAAALQGINANGPSDNPVIGGTRTCRRWDFHTGIAPATNRVFASVCLQGDLLDSVLAPGYHAEYKNYKKFEDKHVAHTIREYLEPGEELEAKIDELQTISAPDETSFAITDATAPLNTLKVSEQTLRSLATNAAPIQWPKVKDGKQSGVLSIYVCVDRDGHVRETYGLNSDNPHMTDAAREQVAKWQFKPAANAGQRVQVESILTFAFDLTNAKPPAPAGR